MGRSQQPAGCASDPLFSKIKVLWTENASCPQDFFVFEKQMNGGTAIELSAPVLFLTFLLLQLKQALLLFLSFLPAQHLALYFHLLMLQAQCLLGFCSNSHILNLAARCIRLGLAGRLFTVASTAGLNRSPK